MRPTFLTKLLVPALFVVASASEAQQATHPTASAGSVESSAARAPNGTTVVLVHGAFADASGWSDLIAILQRDGYNVVAAQNPLQSLEGDVATTRRLVDAQKGPVILVGHSYGGAVISAAAAGNASVKALVYVAAFGPDAGEPSGAFFEKYPSDLGTALVPDAAGFVYIDPAKYGEVFAGDLPARQTRVMAAAQKPIFNTIFGQSSAVAAWRTIPSWYVVAREDRAINPELQRFYAQRMNARTTEVKASHVVFISQPMAVAKIVRDAAAATIR